MVTRSKYEQAKNDYEFLVEHHKADIYDITGGYIEGDHYKDLLSNPCKANATKHFVAMIEYSSCYGFDSNNFNTGASPDLENKRVCGIYRNYNCEAHILTHWGVDLWLI